MAQRKRPALNLNVDKSPAKKGGNAPTMQDYPSDRLNAWMLICKLRHSATAPERKTGKGILNDSFIFGSKSVGELVVDNVVWPAVPAIVQTRTPGMFLFYDLFL